MPTPWDNKSSALFGREVCTGEGVTPVNVPLYWLFVKQAMGIVFNVALRPLEALMFEMNNKKGEWM